MTINSISDRERESERTGSAESPPDALVDQLAELLPGEALQDALRGLEPEEITGPGGLLTQLAGRVIETALAVEMTDHLGHPPGGRPQSANVRNGHGHKTVKTELGPVEVRSPRDRDGSFEPKLIGKRQTRLAGLDDKILGLYGGGMTVRDIQAHLAELYGLDIGRDQISRITDAVLEDVAAWRTRPLERVYPIVYFDAMFVKVREDRSVRSRACYLALGVTCDGDREVLGLWWQDTEGAKFWLAVLNDLRRRGVEDVLIACVDGLKGLPGGDRGHLPTGMGADLHRPPHPQQPALRQLPRPEEGRISTATDLQRPQRRASPRRARALRRRMGSALSTDGAGVALLLGARHPVSRPARRAAPRRLHHQHDRGPAPPDPQGHQDPRALSRRTGRHQTHLPRPQQGRPQVAPAPHLDSTPRRPQDPLRRPLPRLTPGQTINSVTAASHTEERTVSDIELADEQLAQLLTQSAGHVLTSLPGVATVRAAQFSAFALPIERWPTPEHLYSATGLAPATYQSSTVTRRGRISRQGLAEHRNALMGIAWGLSQNSDAFGQRDRELRARGMAPIQARVALARHACRLCWRLLHTQQPFDERRYAQARRRGR